MKAKFVVENTHTGKVYAICAVCAASNDPRYETLEKEVPDVDCQCPWHPKEQESTPYVPMAMRPKGHMIDPFELPDPMEAEDDILD